jgi:hypothetical protein
VPTWSCRHRGAAGHRSRGAGGLAVDRGVSVDRYLATSVAGIYAAGDIARWPDRLGGEPTRVEHWVVAERQGRRRRATCWGAASRSTWCRSSGQSNTTSAWPIVGHAERFDEVRIDGTLEKRDCTLSYWRGGRKLAVAVVHRDLEGLRSEIEFERALAAAA